jgi:hypothetical protein
LKECVMPTNLPVAFLGANAVVTKSRSKVFDDDFFAVALFSGTGLLLALIAITCGEQGIWF